jgi:hypothetical protein
MTKVNDLSVDIIDSAPVFNANLTRIRDFLAPHLRPGSGERISRVRDSVRLGEHVLYLVRRNDAIVGAADVVTPRLMGSSRRVATMGGILVNEAQVAPEKVLDTLVGRLAWAGDEAGAYTEVLVDDVTRKKRDIVNALGYRLLHTIDENSALFGRRPIPNSDGR